MYKIIKPKNHEEWLKCREGGIGSSEVGTILGVNPWDSPYQLWRRKKGLDAPKSENFAMRAGHYLEDAVSRFYQDESGKEVIKSSAGDWLMVDIDKPYLRVSPDRTFWLSERHSLLNKGILECKTTQKEIDGDNLPAYWYCQIQYQLGVAGLEYGAIAWLTQGRKFGYKDILFDKELYTYMVDEIERFWIDNIIGGKEPAAITAADVVLQNPRHIDGKILEADNETLSLCGELKKIKEQQSELVRRKEEIEDALKITMADAEALSYAGKIIATWRTSKDSMKFDEKRFASEYPESYGRYMRTVQGTRRFIIK